MRVQFKTLNLDLLRFRCDAYNDHCDKKEAEYLITKKRLWTILSNCGKVMSEKGEMAAEDADVYTSPSELVRSCVIEIVGVGLLMSCEVLWWL